MSYLNPLRLHFAGQFQAAISTVNNDPNHYNNRTFKPEFQDLQTATAANGWFNPRGDATWRLLGCRVTGAWTAPETPAPAGDPVLTCLIADSDRNVPAKLVDLDPQQQMVSMVFGLEVRIVTSDGATNLLRSRFEPAPFTDIWTRAQGQTDDMAYGATYQSVLTDLEWGETGGSEFLTKLRAAAADGLLSIKFNVDSFNLTFTSPDFMKGRIVGTIGPAAADEPRHFELGRHFMTGNPNPAVNFCVAKVDNQAKKIYLDLGNALRTTSSGGTAPAGTLGLGAMVPRPGADPQFLALDRVAPATYTDPGWYTETAGIFELPAGRRLTATEMKAVENNPLVITTTDAQNTTRLAIAEPSSGLYVRADQFVFRLSPGDRAEVRIFATRFGERYPGARVVAFFDPSQLQVGSPPTPESAIDFPELAIAGEDGVAELSILASDPGNPRGFIDGQVFGVRPVLEETIANQPPYPFNPSDFVSLLVFDDFHPDEDPVTWRSLQPILQQFENLYPVMKRFLMLGNYDSVCANQGMLLLAFGLPADHPNAMPVTRDLSEAKRKAIVGWLTSPGPDGKPLQGAPFEPLAFDAAAAMTEALQEPQARAGRGGKTAAASRRLANRALTLGPEGSEIEVPE
jgi:hypothetical protein